MSGSIAVWLRGTSRRTRMMLILVAAAVAAVVLAVPAAVLVKVSLGSGDDLMEGPLVPTDATEALLCSYQSGGPSPIPLTATHRITSGAGNVAAYLNGLPASLPPNSACLLEAANEHVIVFGYANRPAAAVYGRNCAWDQAGAVRYTVDIRKITGFWGIAFYALAPV